MERLKRNRSWLVEAVAAETELESGLVRRVVDAFLEEIMMEVAGGSICGLENFGTFHRVKRKSYLGRDPRAEGTKVVVPERHRVLFRTGKRMREMLEKG